MAGHKASGRRRASVPIEQARPRAAATGRRRAQPAPSQMAAAARGVGHKTAVVAAASGMALTVMLPTTAGAAADGQPDLAAASSVSAAAGAQVAFERAGLTSNFDPDVRLKDVMVASDGNVEPVSSEGSLSQPMDELTMTSPFGYRVSPITGYAGELHTGQDYGAACGSPVYAAAGGRVVEAGFQGGAGNRIVVDHGNGLKTTYNHLSAIETAAGATIERGALIAQAGTTGNSTGCHLHFEVMVDDKVVDPGGWL